MKNLFTALLLLLVTTTSFASDPVDLTFIHPEMEQAIEQNEQLLTGVIRREDPDFIVVNGQRFYTGFSPTRNFYLGAKAVRFNAPAAAKRGDLPKSWDMRKWSHSPVRGQLQGSCWAEANVSAFELTWNFITGLKEVFAVDDVIQCSGYGTARSGGQLSMAYNVKEGLAHEADYPYTAKDGRCRESVDRHRPLKAAPFLRGANGGFPTEPELMAAAMQYGAFEVCGSASALGNGGRQDTIRSGSINHCYAYAGWLDGDEMGWLPGVKYHIIKNSWGDCDKSNKLSNGRCWGDKGYGYYRLSRDGKKLSGSVITEIQVADTGLALQPPGPVVFQLVNSEGDVSNVTVESPGPLNAEAVKKALQAVGF